MTSSRSCGSMIPETAARKAAAAVEPFAVDTGGGAGQLDIVVDVELADDISEHQRANRAPNLCPRTRAPFLMCPFLYLNLANSTTRVSDLNCREKQFLNLRDHSCYLTEELRSLHRRRAPRLISTPSSSTLTFNRPEPPSAARARTASGASGAASLASR